MASSSSTPSSSITLPKRYQVFLSFRGEDTRVGFTGHLDYALRGKQIATFIDYKLERGDEISPALLKSIQESKIAVVIFSKDYASSKWCLRELAEIVKCKKLNELLVLPIFYYVDPSDVRNQTGPFKDSFAKHENESQDEVKEWREAFTEASKLAGWPYDGTRPEFELVRDIVEDVQRKLMSEIENISLPLNDFEGLMPLIGIDKQIKQVMPLLCLDTMDVRIIGFWGMGGIGKTTLAKAVFNRISCQFDGACFIEKVGERLESRESNRLLLEVLSEVLHENLKLETLSSTIPPFIKERFNRAKVFIVLDDVINFIKLETLVKGLFQCGLGSRIIMTSRDKQVLDNFKVLDCNIYKVEGLNFDEALMLFSNYAFSQNHPTEDFMDLSVRMVCYTKGNPLALKVLGSCLLGMSKPEWESALVDLQGIGGSEIFNVLKLSYDRLNDKEKDLFLDIACFFYIGVEHYAELLDCKYSLRVLINKSLITIEHRRIKMHDLLQEMGREIVRRESPKNPGQRSRLWKSEDVIWTLKNDNETKAVEGISLNNINLKDLHLNLSCQVFDKMPNLRLLLFTNFSESNKVHLPHGLNSLPDELIIIEWDKYPLRVLPSNFSPAKLVKLDLSYSNIEQLWKGTKPAPKLKQLILRFCPRLTRIPNLSDFLSLEEVYLIGCRSLVEFPSSVQQLRKLRYLSLLTCYSPTNFGCSNVTKFPPISVSIERLYLSGTAIKEVPSSIQSLTNLKSLYLSKCTRLKHIPSSICDLTSLEELNLSNCSKLDKLPENMGNLKFLKDLNVGGSGVHQLPSSITCLENLEFLNCSGLTILPPLAGFCSLSRLCLNNCNLMEIPEDIGCLSSLKWLNLGGNMFESLPKSIKHLSKLEGLSISDCNMLRSLTELPALEWLEAINCKQLCQALPDAYEFKRFITSKNFTYHEYVKFLFTNSFNVNQKAVSKFFEESLKGLEEPPTQFYIYLPGTEIPEWFTYQSSGSSVNIQVLRQDLVNRKIMGFAICAVLGFEEYHNDDDFLSVIVYRHFETYDDHIIFPQYNTVGGHKVFINSDHILLGYPLFTKFYPSSQNLEMIFAGDSDYIDISFKIKAMSKDYKVKHYAVHPIYAEPKEIIGATIEDIGETSGRRSGRSDDIEEVEPTS